MSTPPSLLVVSCVRVETEGAHDRVQVWNRGGLAGELVVDARDGDAIAERLHGAGQIVVSSRELWLMVLSTVRYALGRSSYFVSDAFELVMLHRDKLAACQIAQLADEVDAELRRAKRLNRPLGMEMDHAIWERLVTSLRGEDRTES